MNELEQLKAQNTQLKAMVFDLRTELENVNNDFNLFTRSVAEASGFKAEGAEVSLMSIVDHVAGLVPQEGVELDADVETKPKRRKR